MPELNVRPGIAYPTGLTTNVLSSVCHDTCEEIVLCLPANSCSFWFLPAAADKLSLDHLVIQTNQPLRFPASTCSTNDQHFAAAVPSSNTNRLGKNFTEKRGKEGASWGLWGMSEIAGILSWPQIAAAPEVRFPTPMLLPRPHSHLILESFVVIALLFSGWHQGRQGGCVFAGIAWRFILLYSAPPCSNARTNDDKFCRFF